MYPNMPRPFELPVISVAVLAGGRGRRLGRNKVQLALGRHSLLWRVLTTVAPLSDDIMVVARAGEPLGDGDWSSDYEVRWLQDRSGAHGVLAGMATGLAAARHDWLLILGCDMPFIRRPLLRYIISQRQSHDLVVPRLEVGLEPLHALYHRNCLYSVEAALDRGERRVSSFFSDLNVRYLDPAEMAPWDPQGRSFFNINTPDDLERARQWLAE